MASGRSAAQGSGKLVLYLRRVHREAVGLDEFLALGLIALSYGIALLVNAYGFLAVFAAGLSVRRIEREHSEVAAPPDVEQAGTQHRGTGDGSGHRPRLHGACGPQFQRATGTLGELAVVLVVGAMLADIEVLGPGILLALSLFVVIRPAGDDAHAVPRAAVKTAASVHCMVRRAREWARCITWPTRCRMAYPRRQLGCSRISRWSWSPASIVLHGVSVTPLMQRYSAFTGERQPQ